MEPPGGGGSVEGTGVVVELSLFCPESDRVGVHCVGSLDGSYVQDELWTEGGLQVCQPVQSIPIATEWNSDHSFYFQTEEKSFIELDQ